MKTRKAVGNILLILTSVIWGSAFVSQRVGMESIEPITFNAARMALAAAATWIVSLIIRLKNSKKIRFESAYGAPDIKSTVPGGVLCGLFLSAASISQQTGIVYTTAGKAGFITAMYIVIVPVISFFALKRRYPIIVWGGVAVGVAGMCLLCLTDGFSLTKGDALIFFCALMFSFHILCCDRFVRRGDPVMMAAIQFTVCAAVSAVFALIFEQPSWDKIASAAIPILYCGLISGGVGYTLQIVAQKMTDPAIAAMIMSLEAVFAVLSGAIIRSVIPM